MTTPSTDLELPPVDPGPKDPGQPDGGYHPDGGDHPDSPPRPQDGHRTDRTPAAT